MFDKLCVNDLMCTSEFKTMIGFNIHENVFKSDNLSKLIVSI